MVYISRLDGYRLIKSGKVDSVKSRFLVRRTSSAFDPCNCYVKCQGQNNSGSAQSSSGGRETNRLLTLITFSLAVLLWKVLQPCSQSALMFMGVKCEVRLPKGSELSDGCFREVMINKEL